MKLDILARHTIAALAGCALHAGYTVDQNSLASFLTAGVFAAISILWSWLAKAERSDSTNAQIQKLAGAIGSQLAALIAGWMQSENGGDVSPEAALLFGANALLSHVRGHVPPAKLGQWQVIALCSLLSALCSCSNPAQEALKNRLETALVSAGREMSATALEATLQTLRAELTTLEAKPIDTDPMQQLLDSSRVQTIRAAIRLGEERLAKLRAASSSSKSPPPVLPPTKPEAGCLHHDEDATAMQEGRRVTIPHFAPRVVLLLRSVKA